MDYNDPDFVPSVFPNINPNPATKKKVKRYETVVSFDWLAQNRASIVLAQANLSQYLL